MRIANKTSWKVTAIGLCVLALTACGDDKKSPAEGAAPAPAAAAKPAAGKDSSQEQIKARNAYSSVYNSLIDDNRSVAAKYKSYQRQNINGKQQSANSFYGAPSDIDRDMQRLKDARTTGSGDAGLDSAVDGVIAAGQKLSAIWTTMDPYFRGKGFLEDKWAKAKENDAAMTAGFTGMLTAIDKFGAELDRVEDAKRQERLAKLKADGDMLNYSVINAMGIAKALVSGVEQTDNLKNKDAIAKVDDQAKLLDAALVDLNKAIADEKQKTGKDPHYGYKQVADYLTSTLGNWRTLKASPSSSNYQSMVRNYNFAVGASSHGFQ